MAVKLRMKMMGRTNRPEFRVVAADARSPRDGRIIENLGYYHPQEVKPEKVMKLDWDRIKHWLSVGAQPSETLQSIFKKHGVKLPWEATEKKARTKMVEARRAAKATKKGAPKAAAKPAAAKAEKPAKKGK